MFLKEVEIKKESMKAYLVFLLLIFCLNLNGKQQKNFTRIILYKVDLDIETVIAVSPNCFFSTFESDIDTIVKSKSFYDVLHCNLNNKYISKNNNSLDTRYIIKIEYNQGLADTIYGDRFNLLFKSKYYKITPLLLSLIKAK